MLIFIFLIIFLELNISSQNKVQLNDYVSELTENLMSNLLANPFFGESSTAELSETSKEFIDKRIEQYSKLVLTFQQKEFSRSKRSLAGDGREDEASQREDGVTDLTPYRGMPIPTTNDLTFFQQNFQWYTIFLETSTNGSSIMKILKYQENGTFTAITQMKLENGVRIATFPIENSTLIIVAENVTESNHVSNIYQFNLEEKLKVIQKINGTGYTDVSIWEDNGNVFMSLVGFMGNSAVSSSSFPRLYKWRGRHFDVLQDIRSGATRISPFLIGDLGFLAVTYNTPDNGEEDEGVYSEILKYNVNTEKYELFQKILTYGCDDIKYFEIDTVGEMGNKETERFLVVANFYEKDSSGNISYDTRSIIYKFVDNYFYPFQSIALKGVKQWEPIKNEHGDLLLIALTLDGIKTFQYDGWHFIRSSIRFTGEPTNKDDMLDVKTLRSFKIGDKQLLVAPRDSPNQNRSQIFEVKFSRQNKLRQFHDQMLSWCQEKTRIIEERDGDILQQALKRNEDDEPESDSQIQGTDLEKLTANINKYNLKLSSTEQKLRESLQSAKSHVIDRDINAKLVLIKSTGKIDSLTTKSINDFDIVNLLDNKLNINDDFQINSELKVDFLRVDATLIATTFNNHSVNNIIDRSLPNQLNTVIINGSAIFNDNISITNTLNDITIGKDTLLLKSGDQNLANLRVSEVNADKVNTEAINGQSMDKVDVKESIPDANTHIPSEGDQSGSNSPKEKVKRLKELRAKNLIVGGLINEMDIPTLEKYGLKKAGNKDIAKKYVFGKLEAEVLETDSLTGIDVSKDLVLINSDGIKIEEPTTFSQHLTIKNLLVTKHLNNLQINKKGDIDVLFRNSTDQHVSGLKTFENLELMKAIYIQGKIKSKYFDRINPLVTVPSDLNLTKNVTITGNVSVENILKAVDVISKENRVPQVIKPSGTLSKEKHSDVPVNDTLANSTAVKTMEEDQVENTTSADKGDSMMRVLTLGVKLVDEKIEIPVSFLQQVSAEHVQVDLVNELNPSQFVEVGAKLPVNITGWKTFAGDLEITGNTEVSEINGILTSQLANDVLTIHTDQEIHGKHHVNNVIVVGNLETNETKLGNHFWKDVVTTSDNQTIEGILTLNTLLANSTSVKNINTTGKVNGISFSEMLQDAVPRNKSMKIFGTKTFQTLNVTHLWASNNFDLDKHKKEVEEKKFVLENVNKLGTVSVEKVFFRNSCNGLTMSRFEKAGLLEDNGTRTVEEQLEFGTVKVLGTVFVQNNQLNDVDLDDFDLNTVKIDEPCTFNSADFGQKLVVTPLVTHHGEIENLDLDNLYENGKHESQTILDKITFNEDITINGTVHMAGFLNGVNVSDLCGILSESKGPKKLVVEGNVHFTKGPRIREFNGKTAKDIESTIWYTDSPVTLSGNIAFDNNVTLRDEMTVKGLLNDVNIDYLSNKYLSKTKDQKIVALVNILNTTIFKRDVATPVIAVDGLINGIKLEDFLKNTLLHRPQLLEDLLYFEEVTANHLEGNYLVNKLNLDSEVMRYDRPNLITGSKTFENLDVDVLSPESETTTTSPAKVQEVDVGQWLRGAVLKEGNFKIEGRKTFKNVEVKEGTSLLGHFNGLKLEKETVMLKTSTQNISGKKTFVSNTSDEVKFKALNVKGSVNGADFEKLLRKQAYKNEDNRFNSSLKFCNNIFARNLIFEKKYSDVDVSELLQNITTLGTLNHIKEKYKNLKNMADEVEASLKEQAYFLDYYKPVHLSFEISELFSLKCTESEGRMVSFRNDTGSNILQFLDWDEKQEIFINKSSDRNLGPYPNYLNELILENKDQIYLEHETKTPLEDNTHTGRFMACKNDEEIIFGEFLTRGTLFVTSFKIKSQDLWCLLFIDFNFDINIPCAQTDKQFHHHQTISIKSPVMASVVTVNEMPILVTINTEVDKKTTIWTLNKDNKFQVFQLFHDGDPISVSTVSTQEQTFLAVAYKHLPNTKDIGKVVIRRYDDTLKTFSIFQTIHVSSPTKVELALLPSKEIGLYVITDNPSEPLTAYLYSGIVGFVKKIGSPTIPKVADITTFSFKNQHFVVIKHEKEVSVLQAVFKGSKFNDNTLQEI